MDWILKSSKSQVFFYDALQVIGPAGVEYEKVNQKLAMWQRRSMSKTMSLKLSMTLLGLMIFSIKKKIKTSFVGWRPDLPGNGSVKRISLGMIICRGRGENIKWIN